MAASSSVAVIGGGISGLACAQYLKDADQSLRVTVFDTGKHAAGGRCSTRTFDVGDGRKYIFDHAVQCFKAKSDVFRDQVDQWIRDGVVTLWSPSHVGTLFQGNFTPSHPSEEIFKGTNGAQLVVSSLCHGIDIQRPVWISKISCIGGKWHLYNYDKFVGQYTHLVIAHNGKCADSLTKTGQIPKINRLLKTRFGAKIPEQYSTGGQMQLCSLWVVMIAFSCPLDLPFEGVFIEGSKTLSWAANNSKKLNTYAFSKGHECWTLISTREFGELNKVPQENIPTGKKRQVIEELLSAFQTSTKIKLLPKPVFAFAQLWGAAVPLNILHIPCVFQASTQVGVCGDWLLDPSIEGAYLSGMNMGKVILNSISSSIADIGLDCKLMAITTHAIGNFPKCNIQQRQLQACEACISQDDMVRDSSSIQNPELAGDDTMGIKQLTEKLEELCRRRKEMVASKNSNAKKRLSRKIRETALQLKEKGADGMDKYLS